MAIFMHKGPSAVNAARYARGALPHIRRELKPCTQPHDTLITDQHCTENVTNVRPEALCTLTSRQASCTHDVHVYMHQAPDMDGVASVKSAYPQNNAHDQKGRKQVEIMGSQMANYCGLIDLTQVSM